MKLVENFYPKLLFGFLCCVSVYYGFLGRISVDEMEGIHTAWKILNGEVIYRDFFQHHHPLFYYALIPIIQIGGENIFTFYLAEIFAFLIFSGIVITTFLLSKKIYNDRKISWFSVILLLTFPFFIFKGTEIRPDILQVLLGLLSIYFLVIYLKNEGSKKHFFGSAILLSLSFLVLQKAIFLIFTVGLFSFVFINPKITIKDFILYWTAFAILPALYAIFLLVVGDWQNYFDFNWLINIRWQEVFSPLKHFSSPEHIFMNPLSPEQNFLLGRKLLATLVIAGFVFLFGCAFKIGKINRLHGFVIFAGVVLALSLFLVKSPWQQYFLAPAPFFAIVSAFVLRRLFSGRAAKIWLAVFVSLSAWALILEVNSGAYKKRVVSQIEYVLSVSAPEDLYFGYRRNLFRKDADFFWFCMGPGRCTSTYSGFRDYDFNPVRIIKETHPKVIYAPYGRFGFDKSARKYLEASPDYERSAEDFRFYIRKDD